MLLRHKNKIFIDSNKKQWKLSYKIIASVAGVIILATALYFGLNQKTEPSVEATATAIPTMTTTTTQSPTPSSIITDKTSAPPVTPTLGSTPNPDYPYGSPIKLSKPVTEEYFKDAVFIGDSRTEGFMLFSGLSGSTFFVHKGLSVKTIFTEEIVKVDAKTKITAIEALKKQSFSKVYVMLGVNELGWSYSSAFKNKYGELIDAIKSSQPNARIYIQSILPVTAERSENDEIYNNKKIEEYNRLLLELTREKKVFYVNVAEAMKDKKDALFADASTDGIHLTKPYCQKWLGYLKEHTVS